MTVRHVSADEVVEAYRAERSMGAVGRRFGIGRAVVARLLDEAGVVRSRGNQGHCRGMRYRAARERFREGLR